MSEGLACKTKVKDGEVYEKVAFKMTMKPDADPVEYKQRHDNIWPEVVEALHGWGMHDYSIFLDEETRTLYATLWKKQGKQGDAASGELGIHPAIRKWWDDMARYIEYENNVPKTTPLSPMFNMD